MWHLYLDESGDLGFDFVNKKPSKFFTVCIFAVSSDKANKEILKEAKLTLRRKINNKRKKHISELKGTKTTQEIKEYFYNRVKGIHFGIYAITLNKRKVYEKLTNDKTRVYNYIARQVLDRIPFEQNSGEMVSLILDRSMSKPEIQEFNSYIRKQLEGRIPPSVPLNILHELSHENYGLQIVDLFSWGIFQKYERQRSDWYSVFCEKVRYDEQFL